MIVPAYNKPMVIQEGLFEKTKIGSKEIKEMIKKFLDKGTRDSVPENEKDIYKYIEENKEDIEKILSSTEEDLDKAKNGKLYKKDWIVQLSIFVADLIAYIIGMSLLSTPILLISIICSIICIIISFISMAEQSKDEKDLQSSITAIKAINSKFEKINIDEIKNEKLKKKVKELKDKLEGSLDYMEDYDRKNVKIKDK